MLVHEILEVCGFNTAEPAASQNRKLSTFPSELIAVASAAAFSDGATACAAAVVVLLLPSAIRAARITGLLSSVLVVSALRSPEKNDELWGCVVINQIVKSVLRRKRKKHV